MEAQKKFEKFQPPFLLNTPRILRIGLKFSQHAKTNYEKSIAKIILNIEELNSSPLPRFGTRKRCVSFFTITL